MSNSNIHYAVQIDLSNDNTDTDADIGLYAGYFRWVTDRPDYDGATVVPTGDNDGNVWKEGVLTDRKQLGQAVRMINILASGDYGTLSGFSLSVDNTSIDATGTGDKFSDAIFDNDYFLVNRKCSFYVVIADVFYQAWTGIVTKDSHNELKFSITCEDDFKTIHKNLPPKTITKRQFPNLASKSEGKTIPVCFGYCNNAKLVNVSVQNDAINLLSSGGNTYKTAPIYDYTSATKTITILTGELYFGANDLANFYSRHILDGDDQVLRIVSNTVSTQIALIDLDELTTNITYKCDLVLEGELTHEPVTTPADEKETYPPADDLQGCWVEIFDFKSIYIVSNEAVSIINRGDGNEPIKLKYWNKDSDEWLDVSEIGDVSNISDIEGLSYPGIKMLSKIVDFDGNYSKLTTFAPKSVKYKDVLYTDTALSMSIVSGLIANTDYENLRNYNQSSTEEIITDVTNATGGDINSLLRYEFEVMPPDELKNADYEDAFFLADWDLESNKNHSTLGSERIEKGVRDSFSSPRDDIGTEARISTNTLTADTAFELRTIPGSHYNTDEGNQSQFEDTKTDLSVVSWFTKSKIFRSYPIARFYLGNFVREFAAGVTTRITVTFRELCFGISRNINVVSEDIYTKLIGEKVDSTPTTTIYYIIRRILEDYDGISTSGIDYDNLLASRGTWDAGRQILKRVNSKDLLQEIARQSFIGIYPTRAGKRGLKAFRDDETFSSVVHASDTGTIIADSISRFEKSDINQVYNDFEIKYDYNPASDDYEQSIFIHKADEDTFPAQLDSTDSANDTDESYDSGVVSIKTDGTCIVDLTYTGGFSWASVGGYASINDSVLGLIEFGEIIAVTATTLSISFNNNGNYVDGSIMTTLTVKNQATGLQKWKEYAGGYTDYNRGSELWDACHTSYTKTGRIKSLPESLSLCKWYIELSEFYPGGPGDNSSAHKYLDEVIEWSTRQKRIAEYKIPLTATNITLELLTAVTFRDQKFTDGDDRVGYITKIKINPSDDTMTIEATLEPADIDSVTDCFIQESITNTDLIQEATSNTDFIQEGSC